MDVLLTIVDDLIARNPDICNRKGNSVRVRVDRFDRTQRILLARKNDLYVLTSVVAYVKDVAGTNAVARRKLLLRIWTRNALKPLVSLRIDGRDRIVGQIMIPVGQESPETIEFYLRNLARDCDRFEYILTGLDQH